MNHTKSDVEAIREARALRQAAEGFHHREPLVPSSKKMRRKRARRAKKYETRGDDVARWLVSDGD